MIDRVLFSRHLEDEELVHLIVHRHWIFGFSALAMPSIVFAGLWALLFFAPNQLMLAIVALAEVACVVWWLRNFFDYYLDAWIITDHGIVDLAWHGWFHRESTRVLYSDIQGVSYEIHGILGTLFRFGTLSVEKISSGGTMSLPQVSSPRSVENLILTSMESYLHSKNLKDAATVQKLLSEFVASSVQKEEAVRSVGSLPREKASVPPVKRSRSKRDTDAELDGIDGLL